MKASRAVELAFLGVVATRELAATHHSSRIMSTTSPARRADVLLTQRAQFKAFLVSRLRNEADAEDVLQNGLLKALHRADDIREDAKLTAWFYQILRNALVDHVRSKRSAEARDHIWASDAALTAGTAADQRALCRCFEPLIDSLKPKHAALLRAVELEGKSVSAAAIALGITANNASVTLLRARAELRKRLEEFCGDCAKGACLDCDCAPAKR